MPLDERIRSGLERSTPPSLDARANFRRAVVEARRRRRRNGASGAIVVVAVAALSMIAGPDLDMPGRPAVPATATPSASRSGPGPIDGIYRVDITTADGLATGLPLGEARILAGSRVLTISLGTIRLVDPTSFDTLPLNGTFEVRGRRVVVERSPSGSEPPLVLGWQRHGAAVSFEVVSGAEHAAERIVWSAHPWRVVD